ncbi:uncharacterized protein BX663DRAFT_499437 [Cokeromyces recurvatus]|uniref:uncharacterized protein n=1 Tax=Cokeromyces recurvatus TaxID=90255 RepID=UPI00221E75CD|nr:uncharacterized protein BX663DRAFT_499437 [Cokeromyces recurvatus]KAI7906264.1 hypothetical protein BX663DRAFT_499437 [Cokeromyces recurvatus]
MYYVDLNVGLELLDMLTFITNNTTNNDIQPAINVILHPAVGGYPTAWEFTLIIVVALLAISFLASGMDICFH